MDIEQNAFFSLATVESNEFDFQPKTFDDYCGQTDLKKKLRIYAEAARMRNEPLDHVLLFGPPGLGKTTLATIMAHMMNVAIRVCSGPTLERTGDLVAILSGLGEKDILFIDEIHRIPSIVEEVLYTAMEQFYVDVIIGQGSGAKSIRIPLQPFTLIGATTKAGMISAPLRSRFGITERFDFYTPDELCEIVVQNARFVSVSIASDAAHTIASAARGTPRVAKKLFRRVRDVAQVENNNKITREVVTRAFSFLGVDQDGLMALDHRLLDIITNHFGGGPVGVETLASMIGEDVQTIEDVYEPFLLRQGLLEKTPRGRQIPRSVLAKRLSGQNSLFE